MISHFPLATFKIVSLSLTFAEFNYKVCLGSPFQFLPIGSIGLHEAESLFCSQNMTSFQPLLF